MLRLCLALLVVSAAVGCDSKLDRFQSNRVYSLSLSRSRYVGTDAASTDVAKVIEALFGAPEQPRWPTDLLPEQLASVISLDNLARAAGTVSSDEQGKHRGLYIEHCVTCHGLAGSGAGPAALLQNPYPRDFRRGVFKWKSTFRAAKPTRGDMSKLLEHGAPGTGMPSFALIDSDDREALIDYVIFLSVRGEAERKLLDLCVDEFGYDDEDTLPDEDRLTWPPSEKYADDESVPDVVREVVESWQEAESQVVPVAPPPEISDHAAAIARGRKIFHSSVTNCVGCHGKDGNGQVLTLDYDDWTKEFSTRIGLTPTDREDMKPFRKAGALRPRQIFPRNLQSGVFRGGGDGQTLYRRIGQGISGTPMPAVEMTDEPSPKGLTSDQVWDLIYYLQSLGPGNAAASANP